MVCIANLKGSSGHSPIVERWLLCRESCWRRAHARGHDTKLPARWSWGKGEDSVRKAADSVIQDGCRVLFIGSKCTTWPSNPSVPTTRACMVLVVASPSHVAIADPHQHAGCELLCL